MANYVVLKKKNNVISLEASRVNLKRAELIANHPHDRYATYLIAEVVETIKPSNNEDRESLQETID